MRMSKGANCWKNQLEAQNQPSQKCIEDTVGAPTRTHLPYPKAVAENCLRKPASGYWSGFEALQHPRGQLLAKDCLV